MRTLASTLSKYSAVLKGELLNIKVLKLMAQIEGLVVRSDNLKRLTAIVH